jgi:hypothetical protein
VSWRDPHTLQNRSLRALRSEPAAKKAGCATRRIYFIGTDGKPGSKANRLGSEHQAATLKCEKLVTEREE